MSIVDSQDLCSLVHIRFDSSAATGTTCGRRFQPALNGMNLPGNLVLLRPLAMEMHIEVHTVQQQVIDEGLLVLVLVLVRPIGLASIYIRSRVEQNDGTCGGGGTVLDIFGNNDPRTRNLDPTQPIMCGSWIRVSVFSINRA